MEQLTKNSNATHSASRSSPIVTKAAYSGRTGSKGMKEDETKTQLVTGGVSIWVLNLLT